VLATIDAAELDIRDTVAAMRARRDRTAGGEGEFKLPIYRAQNLILQDKHIAERRSLLPVYEYLRRHALRTLYAGSDIAGR
jgi:hypothetical protein